ncbi:hypothetical protein HanXRQr2_Chr16g0739111 [Helianthus annuus]|uniref:Uncharacterized protein n=1 Tax=Helianthus annuus TaxID=4232 RepID=A0A251RY05_HELAN|nr:uncharacterized protein LOC110917017 [Helianthus annuus]KAF5759257.1 hypothetical protein HanXRQr2_Chr16g0739111 [Helianthus annuus]KAJ0437488.1 hypothetical protein HanHA300_Chr16g0602741 [Helianthus annuus]KAJ0459807.1 hypothetical protein HanHA89_Chr16g0653271 [Helianthus annuus]
MVSICASLHLHMDIQLMLPSPATTTTTPYTTAPSTPHHYPNYYYSAPTSPIHTTFHHDNNDNDNDYDDDDDDFAFDFSGQLEPPSISAADELFHCGQIKTSNPLLTHHHNPPTFSKKSSNSFTAAFHQTPGEQQTQPPQNPRETTSPFRISDILSEQDKLDTNNNQKYSLTWYNRWNLKNLLLFRSTSEGSARRRKEPVNRYARVTKGDEDVKNSSFRSTESCGSSRRMVRRVSAHEIHYTANRAVAEEMRRKTYLPYKSGLLGCLGFRNNIGVGTTSSGHTLNIY